MPLNLGSLLWAALQVHTRLGKVIPRQPEPRKESFKALNLWLVARLFPRRVAKHLLDPGEEKVDRPLEAVQLLGLDQQPQG